MMPTQPAHPAQPNPYAPVGAYPAPGNVYAPPAGAYAPPGWPAPVHPAPSEHERVRREHIKAECNVKSIGVLCIIGGALALLSAFSNVSKPEELLPSLFAGGLALASGILLRQLSPVGRILYTVLAVVGLFANAFAAATAPHPLLYVVTAVQAVVAGLYLWLLWNGAASPVFGAPYRREVVPATPHVKPVSSPLVVGAFIGAIVVTAAGTAAVVMTML